MRSSITSRILDRVRNTGESLKDWQPRVDSQFEYIGKGELKSLSVLRPLHSATRVLVEFGIVFVAAYISGALQNPLVYLLAVVLIGSRQHAILMLLHEGSHGRLFRRKALNDWFSEIILAWPLLITAYGFRREHLTHHAFVGLEHDPEFVMRRGFKEYELPVKRRTFYKFLIKHLLGLYTIREYFCIMIAGKYSVDAPRNINIGRTIYYILSAMFLTWTSTWHLYFFFWIVPLVMYLPFALYFRLIAEHFAVQKGDLMSARNTIAGPLERMLISPVNIGYHTDHHLYPSVPYYNLPRLHAILALNPIYRGRVRNIRGYFTGVLNEITSITHSTKQE